MFIYICIYAFFSFEFSQTEYLMQFDYLPKSSRETGALRTEQQLKEAVMHLQVSVAG